MAVHKLAVHNWVAHNWVVHLFDAFALLISPYVFHKGLFPHPYKKYVFLFIFIFYVNMYLLFFNDAYFFGFYDV
jgi:hypothetical protein